MKNKLAAFLLGAFLGTALGFVGNYLLGHRYDVKSFGPSGIRSIKIDRWTGRSWMIRYYVQNGTRTYFWESMADNTIPGGSFIPDTNVARN